MKVFSVYDDKADAFLQPFFMRTEQEAIRAFIGAATEANHQFNLHAADFTLYEIGTFSEQVGSIIPLDPIRGLGNALIARQSVLTGLAEAAEKEIS